MLPNLVDESCLSYSLDIRDAGETSNIPTTSYRGSKVCPYLPPTSYIGPGTLKQAHRQETDAFGTVQIPVSKYWGAQTQRATAVFGIGNEYLPSTLIYTFAIQKIAAARANYRLGRLDASLLDAIVEAGRELQSGHFDSHFPLTVWQTGSGTQTNMNVNEIIANRANELIAALPAVEGQEPLIPVDSPSLGSKYPVHPNDHVNSLQSSNDSFPTVMHIVTLVQLQDRLLPSLEGLRATLRDKAHDFHDIIKIGRTHLMDAVPMTLGQAFDAFAQQISHHIQRVHGCFQRLRELPQGGTAVGSGINAPVGFDQIFCEELNTLISWPGGALESCRFIPAASKFESMGAHDALIEVSGILNGLATTILKMATDIRFLGSGPRCGLNELVIPHDGLTSSIMPGKMNPTLAEMVSQIAFQVIGNHATITVAGAAGGNFELNVAKPVIIYNILQSIDLLAGGLSVFAKDLVSGLRANKKTLQQNVDRSLLQVTVLNPIIGYDKVSKIVKKALELDLTPREAALQLDFVTKEQYDAAIDPSKMIRGACRDISATIRN